jgi:hypothetical protein
MGLQFTVVDWVAIDPARRTRRDWLAWADAAAVAETASGATPVPLPTMLRRRVTPLGQLAFGASYPLAGAAPVQPRFVFASRHGEFGRTLALLQTLAADEPVSPADFSLSVHNALAGLLSIAVKNPSGHTSVAAGSDSFASGLLEAASCVAAAPEQPSLLVYYDEPLPPPYSEVAFGTEASLAMALLLVAPRDVAIELECDPAESAESPLPATGQALDFLKFFLSGAAAGSSRGPRSVWRWRRVAH